MAAADGSGYTHTIMITEHALRALPKVELHRHLDGSVRIATLLDIARANRLDLGARTPAALARLATVTEPLDDLAAVLARFSLLQKALCSRSAISRVAFENVEDAWRDGVVAVELRFAPAFIAAGKSLTADEIVEAVVDGARRGMARFPVEVALIGILPRSAPLRGEPGRHPRAAGLPGERPAGRRADPGLRPRRPGGRPRPAPARAARGRRPGGRPRHHDPQRREHGTRMDAPHPRAVPPAEHRARHPGLGRSRAGGAPARARRPARGLPHLEPAHPVGAVARGASPAPRSSGPACPSRSTPTTRT